MEQPAHPIPRYYRIPLLYMEPPLVLLGAMMLLASPSSFLSTMSPRAATSTTTNSSLAEVRVLTDQLGIMLLLFTFNQAVLLRLTRDPSVWRVVCAGMLMSDVLHTAASARELGWDVCLCPGVWRSDEWVNFGVLGGMGLVRLCVVLGIGLGRRGENGGANNEKVKAG